MNRTLFLIAFIVLPLLLIGCSNHVQLSGTVTYSDDGTPLETGMVVFETETFYSRGVILEGGKYTLITHKPKDGLPPGKYQVYVNGAIRSELLPDGTVAAEIPLITSKYSSPDTSGLEIDVDRSTKTFDFQVDRAPGSKR